MSEIGVGELGSVLPEIILVIGGLLVLILDMAQNSETYQRETGRGFMAITVLFLFVGLIGVLVQWNMSEHTALGVVDIDPLGAFFKLIIYSGMILVAVAGGGYMNRHAPYNGRAEFWSLFLFVTMAMSLAVSASNLLMLFVAFEFLSISSYILAGFMRENERSSEAGLKYFLYGSIASAVMLYGMSWLYGATGSLNIREIALEFTNNEDITVVAIPAVLLILVGLGFKMSLAPFFQWAPDTYDGAPTPVTAYLSTASKTVGFAIATRVFLLGFGDFRDEWIPIFAGLSILTMSVGNLMALRQESVKRMLAYSSVAQAGYILMGLTALVSVTAAEGAMADVNSLGMNGLNGMMIYLFAYLFTNVGAFMVVLAVEEDTGSHDLSAYNGLMQRSPGLAVAMLVFMLSLTGIPLTGGFWGKFYVFGAAIQHQYWFLAIAGFINAGIAAGYYLRVIAAMIFNDSGETPARSLPLAIPIQLTVAICVIVTLWIGVYPPNFIDWANDASRQFLALTF